ncbi:216 kDa protein [Trichovirus armeniacae]|uniref:ORF1 protein n=2 Tax=Trichovirus armeniacae TaxID=307677 RepID=Q5IJA3_9VIRU|nr:216 kDa protein [Apricot pseudo-chlorotic leaf spot virus]AAW55581.1 216 kDa protein [Apricot pseudo-chlorotic leaf spot virus]
MAFSYRTPQEELLNRLPQSQQEILGTLQFERIQKEEELKVNNFSYSLPEKGREWFTKSGVYLSPYSYNVHSHPCCKTLENHILYNVAASYLSKYAYVACLSIKANKMSKMEKLGRSSVRNYDIINRLVVSKDKARYGPSVSPERVGCPKNSNLFIHDEIHYWNKGQLESFLSVTKPRNLWATLVFPPEILAGYRSSILPFIYQFEIQGKNLIYLPDGVRSESYSQPLENGYLLNTNSISVENKKTGGFKRYQISLIYSLGSHHLFHIFPCENLIPEETRRFGPYDLFDVGALFVKPVRVPIQDFPLSTFKKIFIYLSSLKKPDEQSAVAKLRQLCDSDVSIESVFLIQEFAQRVEKDGIQRWSCSFWEHIKDRFFDALPYGHVLEKIGLADDFSRRLMQLKPLAFDIHATDRPNSVHFLFGSTWGDVQENDALIAQIKFGRRRVANGEIAIQGTTGILDAVTKRFKKMDNYPSDFFSDSLAATPLRLSYDNNLSTKAAQTFVILRSKRSELNILKSDKKILRIGWNEDRTFVKKTEFEMERINRAKHISNCALNFHVEKSALSNAAELEKKQLKSWSPSGSKSKGKRKNKFVFASESTSPLGKEREKRRVEAADGTKSNEVEQAKMSGNPINSLKEKCEVVMGRSIEFAIDMSTQLNPSPIKVEKGKEKISHSLTEEFCSHGIVVKKGYPCEGLKDEILSLPLAQLKGKKGGYFVLDYPMVYFHNNVSYPSFEATMKIKECILKARRDWNIDFNASLIQIYEKGSIIGMHKDNEECYDDDGVLTLNVKGNATFSVSCHDNVIELKEGNELLMPPGYQKKFKHGVKSESEGRISVTLRVHKRDFSFRSKVGFIKGKYDCMISSLASLIRKDQDEMCAFVPNVLNRCISNKGCSIDDLKEMCMAYEFKVPVEGDCGSIEVGSHGMPLGRLNLRGNHFSVVSSRRSNLDSLANSKSDKDTSLVNSHVWLNFRKRFLAVEPDYTKTEVKCDLLRAVKLLKSLNEGMTGIVSHNAAHEGWRMIKGVNSPAEMRKLTQILKGLDDDDVEWKERSNLIKELNFINKTVYGVFGFAGSGKSNAIQNLIESEFKGSRGILVVCPRRFLASDWSEKGVDSKDIKTFESALKMDIKGKNVFIFDEVSLLPKGYVDLMILKMHMEGILKTSTIICLGDPLQASYFSAKDDNILSKESEIKRLFKDGVNYKWYSYRINKFIASKLGVCGMNEFIGIDNQSVTYKDMPSAFHFMDSAKNHPEVVLVASMIEKELYSNYQNVMTFGESQGLTFGCGIIVLSEEAKLCSDAHIMVAITRFRKGFCFVLGSKGGKEDNLRTLKGGLLQRIVSNLGASREFITNMSSVPLKLSEKVTKKGAGIDEMDREERLQGDAWLKSMIFLGKRYHLIKPLGQVVELEDSAIKCHIPVCSVQTLGPELGRIQAREYREFKGKNGWSNQLERRLAPVLWRAPCKVNQAMSHEAIYPRHRMDDDLTFLAAIKKRLRFASVAENYNKFRASKARGQYLLKVFLEKIQIKSGRNQSLLDLCRQEFEETKLSKSSATIGAHSQRSDPDWPLDKIFLFMKSQLCTKFEKRFTEAKAGQTLACFQHEILVKFSPWCRYTEKILSSCLPDNFYVHQRKNFSELEKFAKRFSNGSVCVESDYTAFDVSQDHTILAFEVEFLRYVGWDEKIIESYIKMKCTLGCRLGGFAIMRFTGEFSTFLFNTLANMAFTFCRYQVPSGTPICFAGDDMCALRDIKEIPNHEHILEKLSLKAKVNRTKVPMFCGWRLCSDGLIKEPCLIYERLQVAIENNRLMEVIDSYFLEFSFAYKLGERLYSYLEIEQLNYHQVLTRFFIKNKHLLRGESKANISELIWLSDEDGDASEGSQVKDRRRGYSNRWSEKLQNLF